jgi:hypothetical protein
MPYTQFVECRHCLEGHKCIKGNLGFYKVPGPDGYDIAYECKKHIDWRETERTYLTFIKNGFDKGKFKIEYPKDYKGTKSVHCINRIIKYVSNWNNLQVQKAILYIYGNNGTQKTTLANWIGKNIIRQGYNVIYVSMKNLMETLWKSQRDDAELLEEHRLLGADLLIIDEAFDKNKAHLWSSGVQLGYIDSFIRDRINKNLGTIFITNVHPYSISDNGYGPDIQNLIIRETSKFEPSNIFNFIDNYEAEANKLENIF